MSTESKIEAAKKTAKDRAARMIAEDLERYTGHGEYAEITVTITVMDGIPKYTDRKPSSRERI